MLLQITLPKKTVYKIAYEIKILNKKRLIQNGLVFFIYLNRIIWFSFRYMFSRVIRTEPESIWSGAFSPFRALTVVSTPRYPLLNGFCTTIPWKIPPSSIFISSRELSKPTKLIFPASPLSTIARAAAARSSTADRILTCVRFWVQKYAPAPPVPCCPADILLHLINSLFYSFPVAAFYTGQDSFRYGFRPGVLRRTTYFFQDQHGFFLIGITVLQSGHRFFIRPGQFSPFLYTAARKPLPQRVIPTSSSSRSFSSFVLSPITRLINTLERTSR